MTEREIALRYLPDLMFDEKEPFRPIRIGWKIFHEPTESQSTWIYFPFKDGEVMQIEYSIFYIYDIEHLYDLEHVIVFIDKDGNVKRVVGSYHGKFFHYSKPFEGLEYRGTHPIVYVQPGKHAHLPTQNAIYLFSYVDECCSIYTGHIGFLVNDILKGRMSSTPEFDEKVHQYLLKNYAFHPSMSSIGWNMPDETLVPWEQLYEEIPQLIQSEIDAHYTE